MTDDLRHFLQDQLAKAMAVMHECAAIRAEFPEGSEVRARADELIGEAMTMATQQALLLNPDNPNEVIQDFLAVATSDHLVKALQ